MESKSRVPVNYLYFGIFFAFLVLLSASSVFAKESLGGSRIFFFLYAVGQVLLETSFLIFASWVIRRFLGKVCFFAFIGATFFFFVVHAFDFLMDRILDLSIWEVLDVFVFSENLENFAFLLDASGIPLWVWLFFFGLLGSMPFLGMLFYRITEKMVQLRPISVRYESFLQTFFCLPAALLFWDYSASRTIHPDAYTGFLQSLPWKSTFLRPETAFLSVSGPFRGPSSEKEMALKIAADSTVLTKRPNIYLFVVESLRADSITAEIAPHLEHFKMDGAKASLMLSNGNGTHLSWFSIFHSQFPCLWNRLQQEGWEMGSPPLALLKKWGYKIHLYSSAQLGYYGMEQLLFGKEGKLLDSYKPFHHAPPVAAAETDRAALEELKSDLAKDPSLHEGQVFIIFWDSTHFDYSWPKDWTPKFTPFAREHAYFRAFYSEDNIELIKNRYHNAVHYVDSLFGKFLQDLPHSDEAIVVFMGDHGEEFMEKGHLFHNSHLIHEQTHIPLFMKFGSRAPFEVKGVISQMDVFPSILQHVSGSAVNYFEGESIFLEKRRSFAMMSRFNAGRTPHEFCLHNGEHKLIAQFEDRNDIFQSKTLQIRSLRDRNDRIVFQGNPEDWVQKEFGSAFNYLFPGI